MVAVNHSRRRVWLLGTFAAVASLAACNAILDNEDRIPRLETFPDKDGALDDRATSDASSSADGACSTDLTNDAKNGGRCGHDCEEGACVAVVTATAAILRVVRQVG